MESRPDAGANLASPSSPHAVGPAPVILVDPDDTVLAGLTAVLNASPALQVIGTATGRAAALDMVHADTDAVIVIARRFPHDDGREICRALRARAPRARYVLHSAASITECDVVCSGGAAAVLKQLDNSDLVNTIRDLIQVEPEDRNGTRDL